MSRLCQILSSIHHNTYYSILCVCVCTTRVYERARARVYLRYVCPDWRQKWVKTVCVNQVNKIRDTKFGAGAPGRGYKNRRLRRVTRTRRLAVTGLYTRLWVSIYKNAYQLTVATPPTPEDIYVTRTIETSGDKNTTRSTLFFSFYYINSLRPIRQFPSVLIIIPARR